MDIQDWIEMQEDGLQFHIYQILRRSKRPMTALEIRTALFFDDITLKDVGDAIYDGVLFDYVEYEDECPQCGRKLIEFQTRDGDCVMDTLQPYQVKHFHTSCPKCDVWIEYKVTCFITRKANYPERLPKKTKKRT